MLCLLLAGLTAPAGAQQSGGDFRLVASVVANGGDLASSGGEFRLDGSAGQTDAAVAAPLRGGEFALVGGFWASALAPPPGDALFSDGFE